MTLALGENAYVWSEGARVLAASAAVVLFIAMVRQCVRTLRLPGSHDACPECRYPAMKVAADDARQCEPLCPECGLSRRHALRRLKRSACVRGIMYLCGIIVVGAVVLLRTAMVASFVPVQYSVSACIGLQRVDKRFSLAVIDDLQNRVVSEQQYAALVMDLRALLQSDVDCVAVEAFVMVVVGASDVGNGICLGSAGGDSSILRSETGELQSGALHMRKPLRDRTVADCIMSVPHASPLVELGLWRSLTYVGISEHREVDALLDLACKHPRTASRVAMWLRRERHWAPYVHQATSSGGCPGNEHLRLIAELVAKQ